ncbi:family 78 glycoside hydrolase catalytic domain [Streptomyces sp. NPDC006285]|uniref:family 78 glycoside hydrolase catalytic domain n=1 Tax=Streptomyces sp. NPDC006285 TaxID=3364742 RepID=UPI0036897C24
MSLQPAPVTFEHLRDGLGIGVAEPRLSWHIPGPAASQDAYELELDRAGVLHRTGRTPCGDQVLVPWPGPPLNSRERVTVRVRVWTDGSAAPSPWSGTSTVEAGLLDAQDWAALAVGPAWEQEPESDRRPARVRKDFTLTKPVAGARLYITAHGLYEAEINGRRVGDDTLSPGWTVYGERLRYYTYDVTGHLTEGRNAIGAWLADGWYRGRIGFDGGHRNLYGTDQSLIAQLEVHHTDGTTTVVATDPTWQAAEGPILFTGLYEGERFDARLHDPSWSTPNPTGPAPAWTPVATAVRDPRTLTAPSGAPVRCTQEIHPVSVTTTADGRHLLDFGQNLVGRLRITVSGPAGTTVTLRHAEVLQDGELATRPLREAVSVDTYVLDDSGQQTWEPRFTLHGFRHAELTGWPGELGENAVVARVYHTDMRRTGWFECSDPMINRLHENVVWSMRGNFVDIPTDCPQRDERLGWTGDIQVFAPTASFLYDCAGMLDSWLTDVGVEQLPDGTIPWYVPVIPGGPQWTPIKPGAAWGDVSTLTPWVLYQRFGDLELLRRHFPMGRAWVDLMASLAGESRLWDTGDQLGDWLDPIAPPDDPSAARTDRYLVATAYFAWSARHVEWAARALAYEEVADSYRQLADEVTEAFRSRYLRSDGRMTSDAPTAYSLALAFGLLADDQQRQSAGERLAELVLADDARIATGFVGTPLICDALTSTGHVDVAYRLLTQRECPSWLYPVTQGATTIWERWDSLRPDGTLNSSGMTSFNHYALGAVADWMHRVVAGLEPAEPGYRTIRFRPRPGGGITWAKARHETPYGTVAVSWERTAAGVEAQVTVPSGCQGVIELPGQAPCTVGPGVHHLATGDLDRTAA